MMVRAEKPREAPPMLAPECTTMALSEIGAGPRRLDAEVYLSDGYTVRRAIRRSNTSVATLGELADIWQPNRLKGILVEEQDGAPFLAATQVFDVWPTPRKWLARSRTPDVPDRYVEPGWMLVTRSGTVGNVIITYSAHDGLVISDDLLRVQVTDVALRHYIYTFLRTWHGRAMMRGSHYGNIIKHLEVEHLTELPVPIVSRLTDDLSTVIGRVFAKRDEAYRLDLASREALSKAMPSQPGRQSEAGFALSARTIFGGRRRLDGYAHNPRALAVSETVERYGDPVARLGDLAQLVLPGRFARTYAASGTPLLGSEDIFKVNPEITKFLARAMDLDMTEYAVEAGWLLMARSGQIYGLNGSVVLANEGHERAVVSEHVIRIIPLRDGVRPGYLQAFLSHRSLGQPLVLSQAFGTSIPELAPEDIERIPIPRLASRAEDDIADAVERASQLRMEADKEENGAVAKLEAELEKELHVGPDGRQHGPLRISMHFDEVMRKAVKV